MQKRLASLSETASVTSANSNDKPPEAASNDTQTAASVNSTADLGSASEKSPVDKLEEKPAATLDAKQNERGQLVNRTATDGTNTNDGGTSKRGPGGRPKLSKLKNPKAKAKVNAYELVRNAKAANPSFGAKALKDYFRGNKDFNALLQEAGQRCDVKFFRAALDR